METLPTHFQQVKKIHSLHQILIESTTCLPKIGGCLMSMLSFLWFNIFVDKSNHQAYLQRHNFLTQHWWEKNQGYCKQRSTEHKWNKTCSILPLSNTSVDDVINCCHLLLFCCFHHQPCWKILVVYFISVHAQTKQSAPSFCILLIVMLTFLCSALLILW